MAQVTLQNDDNLSPGLTYTFTFDLENIISMPSVSTLLADISSQAPSFIGSPSASWSSGISPFTNYLNVTFTYSGDGSDVVSDVANELIAAFQNGSGDSFSYYQATTGSAGVTALSDTVTSVNNVATGVGTTVGTAIGATVQTATASAVGNLGTSGWIFLLLAIAGILAYFSASTGIRVRSA
jgi:hypothetical protein